MGMIKDMTGSKVGRLTVIRMQPFVAGSAKWLCQCDCGNTKSVAGSHLRRGAILSCGCFRSERTKETHTKHGSAMAGAKTKTYQVWLTMRARCERPTQKDFSDYGGRGIAVCGRWSLFENFLADMGEKPPGLTLDRNNNDGNYEPGNCSWQSRAWQANNQRSNVIIRSGGGEMTLAQFTRLHGLIYSTTRKKIKGGAREIAGLQFDVLYPGARA